MTDSTRYKDWLDKAERDLKSAHILKENDCGNDVVAFHCQQAIEKAFKGYLLNVSSELIEGHSLLFLCKRASTFFLGFKDMMKDCAFVNQYYIETRYPADIPLVVNDEEALECIEIARKIVDICTNNTK